MGRHFATNAFAGRALDQGASAARFRRPTRYGNMSVYNLPADHRRHEDGFFWHVDERRAQESD